MRKKTVLFSCVILLFFLSLLSSCNSKHSVTGTTGTVEEIVNGNTIKLANGIKVILLGVENDTRSKDYMKKHILNKKVRLTADSRDKKQSYKSSKATIRAYVRIVESGTCLNLHLLKQKLAKKNAAYVQDSIHWMKMILQPEKLTLQQIASIARPATFLILTRNEKGISQGTGFFINETGLALTNNHVYNNGNQQGIIYMYDADGKLIPDYDRKIGRIVYTNENYDFTIFQVDDLDNVVPCLPLADGEANTGDVIAAVGNPKVSDSSKLDFNTQSLVLSGRVTKVDQDNNMIYHDANIDHGCSGGPIVNEYGQVISLTTFGLGGVLTTTNLNRGVDIRIVREALEHFDKDYAGK